MRSHTLGSLFCSVLLLPSIALAVDWPQFRGPSADGTTPDRIATTWPAGGPKMLWKVPIGEGFGSFAVAGDKAFVFAEHEGREWLYALGAVDGAPLWSKDIDKTIHESEGGNGPRSTPTVDGDFVYVLGTNQKLACLKQSDGGIVWEHDLVKEFDGHPPRWGDAASPRIDGHLLFVCGGGKGQGLLALDKASGQIAWKTQDDKPTHATPVPATLLGVRQVIFYTQSGLVSVKPETGEVLWRQPFPFRVATAASPVVCGDDTVYCSAGYNVGAGAFTVRRSGDAFTVSEKWRRPGEDVNLWSTPIYKDGYLYGLYGSKEFKVMPLKCIDLKDGSEKWSQRGFGQGGLVMVAGNVLIQGDQGQVVLAKAEPDGYHELARAQPLAGKCWNMPIAANGHVYIRSTKEVACLDASP